MMNIRETLVAYGEWLDGQGLIVAPTPQDPRSHDDLALGFIEDWETHGERAPLPGR